MSNNRPRVFLDFSKNGQELGRVIIELYSDVCPKTVENFRCLCTGEKGAAKFDKVNLKYTGCVSHRIIPGFMVQWGDLVHDDGSRAGCSIYGDAQNPTGFFADETFGGPAGKCDKEGLLCMANRGKDTNRSGVFITTKAPLEHLDGKHVVLGEVVENTYRIVKLIESCGSPTGQPTAQVVITNCGQL